MTHETSTAGADSDFDAICPPLDAVPAVGGGEPWEPVPIHERSYIVRSYRRGMGEMLVRGAVRDTKPPGLYLVDDPLPLTIHHMVVDLVIAMPTLDITDAAVVMETHPNELCPAITDHYRKLIGLSIGRGFTHRVRELFGGPRGCTHVTALLQAMAPVAVQSLWSFSVARARQRVADGKPPMTAEERERAITRNINTCHVWDEHGTHLAELRAGTTRGVPIPISRRLAANGLTDDDWKLG